MLGLLESLRVFPCVVFDFQRQESTYLMNNIQRFMYIYLSKDEKLMTCCVDFSEDSFLNIFVLIAFNFEN